MRSLKLFKNSQLIVFSCTKGVWSDTLTVNCLVLYHLCIPSSLNCIYLQSYAVNHSCERKRNKHSAMFVVFPLCLARNKRCVLFTCKMPKWCLSHGVVVIVCFIWKLFCLFSKPWIHVFLKWLLWYLVIICFTFITIFLMTTVISKPNLINPDLLPLACSWD